MSEAKSSNLHILSDTVVSQDDVVVDLNTPVADIPSHLLETALHDTEVEIKRIVDKFNSLTETAKHESENVEVLSEELTKENSRPEEAKKKFCPCGGQNSADIEAREKKDRMLINIVKARLSENNSFREANEEMMEYQAINERWVAIKEKITETQNVQ